MKKIDKTYKNSVKLKKTFNWYSLIFVIIPKIKIIFDPINNSNKLRFSKIFIWRFLFLLLLFLAISQTIKRIIIHAHKCLTLLVSRYLLLYYSVRLGHFNLLLSFFFNYLFSLEILTSFLLNFLILADIKTILSCPLILSERIWILWCQFKIHRWYS